MKVWLNRFLAIGLAAAFILTVASQANAARYEGLHGNDLIKDVNDINTFPQAASNYKNLFRIDTQSADSGNAWFVVGDDSATYGVKVGESDDPTVPTVLDMIYSMPMGADSLGVGLSLGMGGDTPKDGDASSAMSIGLNIGYSMGAMNLDTALSVQMDSTSDGADSATTTSDMTIGLNARGYNSLGEGTDLGYLVGFEMANTGGDNAGEAGNETSAMDVTLGAGPVYKMDKGQVAAYGTLNYSSDTTTPASGDETSSSSIGFPGFLVSAEVWLSDSLVWRGGASYGYSMDTDEAENGSKAGTSGWSSGLGYKWDKFQVDGALSSGFYNNGPYFISGAGGPLFTHVAASYSF